MSVESTLQELCKTGRLGTMRSFVQHGQVSTLDHVVRVATASLKLAHALRLNTDEQEMVRGALLHDYYLYDWHTTTNRAHALNHPCIAAKNAQRDYKITPKERNIIEAHMWPLPPTRIPKCREAWIVCAADKWCSLEETLFKR